jgi:hypothetical protein
VPSVTSHTPDCFTPPTLARRWGVSADKVLTWLKSGQLRGFNAATNPAGRPRWRIALADALTFEQSRSAQPKPAAPKRRRACQNVIPFF